MSDDLERGGRRALVTRGATGAGRNSDDSGEDFTIPYAKEERRSMATAREVNIVLVHGGFVDGSGWEGVYRMLEEGRLHRQHRPESHLIAGRGCGGHETRSSGAQDRPVILVGHSYGGVVITEAGNDPKVAGLVYIAAFAPDRG